ncbi:metallophosphoesterase [Shewanella sp. 4_MG-2023]|uniref:metallophosphoesterase n=1 Tax=Shewanella sp. 4_MG-2023 TaxID=3062652 RepID=UPI0026E15351|nr:metallophosphoesterase [Shewanella sp. 4_MG-2023]MDO6678426.1 metallophosphoesterase [Shewanella sp. 4_MG-2023]
MKKLIESKHIASLFTNLRQYGLRGNSALWLLLKETLIDKQCNFTSEGLLAWVDQFVSNLPIEQHLGENEVRINALNRGGMSGGILDLDYWHNTMMPILKSRCEDLEQGLMFCLSEQITSLLFVGDVHGQDAKLNALFEDQGFDVEDASSSFVDSKLVFIGDLIDNSPISKVNHLSLLTKVKDLVERKHAYCLLGNHEFNAIGWYLQKADGSFCRDRSNVSNQKQHKFFIQQVGENSSLHKMWIEWFKTLPLFLNFGNIKAIHACWHEESIAKLKPYLNQDNSLKEKFWYSAFDKQHELYQLIETLLKGPEICLPDGVSFSDKTGTDRNHIRVAWWKSRSEVETYRDLAVVPQSQVLNIPTVKLNKDALQYNEQPIFPVVVGHYTLTPTPFPECLSNKVVCVDFNAAKDENPLIGYYCNIDGWDDCPSELISHSGFSYANELNADRVVSKGLIGFMDVMFSSIPPLINHEAFSHYVHQVLLQQWDPIFVYSADPLDEELSNEYADYETEVMRLAQAYKVDELTTYLVLIEQHWIGIEREDSERVCASVAHQIVTAWSEIDTQPNDK